MLQLQAMSSQVVTVDAADAARARSYCPGHRERSFDDMEAYNGLGVSKLILGRGRIAFREGESRNMDVCSSLSKEEVTTKQLKQQ